MFLNANKPLSTKIVKNQSPTSIFTTFWLKFQYFGPKPSKKPVGDRFFSQNSNVVKTGAMLSNTVGCCQPWGDNQ